MNLTKYIDLFLNSNHYVAGSLVNPRVRTVNFAINISIQHICILFFLDISISVTQLQLPLLSLIFFRDLDSNRITELPKGTFDNLPSLQQL